MRNLIEVQEAFDRFGKYVVSQAKSNLTKKKHNDTGKLYESIRFDTHVYPSGAVALTLSMEDYGEYQDKGVKGTKSSAKAPKSTFRFGSGTGQPGGLSTAIRKWVRSRRIRFRDNKGRFISYEATATSIIRSIWTTGIPTTSFYSKPFEQAYKRLPDEVLQAYGFGFERLMKVATKNKSG